MKILVLSFFLFPFSFLFSQGNLQFNKVWNLKYTVAAPNNANTTVGTITVPANKVWKIESASISIVAGLNYNSEKVNLYVDGHLLVLGGGTSTTNAQIYSACPLWLSSGIYPIIVANWVGSPYTTISSLSVIEFNIIP